MVAEDARLMRVPDILLGVGLLVVVDGVQGGCGSQLVWLCAFGRVGGVGHSGNVF